MKPGEKQIVSSTGPFPLGLFFLKIRPEVPILTLKVALLVQMYAFQHIFTLFEHLRNSRLVILHTVAVFAPLTRFRKCACVHRPLVQPRVRRDLWPCGVVKRPMAVHRSNYNHRQSFRPAGDLLTWLTLVGQV